MPPDIHRLRLHLARQRRALCQLDVVEAAEYVVRTHHRKIMDEELAEVHEALAQAQRALARACRGNDLSFIFAAEDELCAVRRRADLLQRQSRQLDVAAAKARTTYLTQRQHLRELVKRLQFLVTRLARRA